MHYVSFVILLLSEECQEIYFLIYLLSKKNYGREHRLEILSFQYF